ncbi:MAG: LamG domain-containing protein [Planctomycetes bacterium]|nr:LamG domain-containing protein [Planctomycetota bacterium]
MRSTANNSESTDLTIFGQDVDDAATFGAGSNNLSIRPMTDAFVDWTNVENWVNNQWHDSPDLSAIIQEIVDRSGWADGNDLVILIRSNDLNGKRQSFSHDDNGTKAAKLHVEYVVSSSGLLGHWAFDEGSGPIAADSSSSANDARLQAGATLTNDCTGTSAIVFDGINDRAVTAQPFSPPSTGTVAFWMRSAGTPAVSSSIFGLSDNWEARQETDGTLSFDLGAEGQPEFVTLTSLDQAGRWYHVVVVFDAGDDSFQVYVDGQLDTSGINGDDMVAQSDEKISFGTRTGSTDYWEGALRDFHIYGTKLTAEEVAELYGMLAYWKLDELSGSVAIDSSGRGNDATYVNSPTLGVNGAFPPKTDTAVLLDGASEYVNSNQSLLNDVDEFTLAGWFNPTNLSPMKSYFGQYGLIEVGIDATTNQIELWTSQGGSINASNLLALGKWMHIAAVGNGTSLTLYVDGLEVATGGSVATTYGSNSNVFKIGEGVMDSSGGYFEGRIDDVRVFSRALCPEEINAVYKGGRPSGVRILQWLETR